jgi:hypothetical protein
MQFKPGPNDQIMIFIGSNSGAVQPTYLLIIDALTGLFIS